MSQNHQKQLNENTLKTAMIQNLSQKGRETHTNLSPLPNPSPSVHHQTARTTHPEKNKSIRARFFESRHIFVGLWPEGMLPTRGGPQGARGVLAL